MADYSRQLFDMFSGVGDSFVDSRKEKRSNMESDRNFSAQQDQFDWRKQTDQRDFDRGVVTSDRSYNRGIFESDRGYGLQERNFNRGAFESDRNYDLARRASERRDIQPLVNSKTGIYDPNTREWIQPPPASGPNGSVSLDNESFDNISGVRKEVQALPSYKNFAQALPIYRSMVETAGRDSKASDLNLVYGLGKIMDPTSVVREGEMVMVNKTSSLPDWLRGAINQLNGGATLSPATRDALLQEAQGRIQGYKTAFDQDAGQYQGIAQRYNINEQDIIPSFGDVPKWSGMPGQQGGQWNDLGGGVKMRQVK
ncbi:hypothetical protein [Kaistia granuli]|uniref:hypothetical protein n=1 Tax=Kaistia granuli TaxID=363259 RepID=UPI00036A610E|nr:hypothetical protein [Kaistia granuli]